MSLKFRLTLFYTAFVAIILSVMAVAVYTLTERSLLSALEERGRVVLEEINAGGDVQEAVRKLPSDALFEPIFFIPMLMDTPEGGELNLRGGLAFPTAVERRNPVDISLYPYLTDDDFINLRKSGGLLTRVTLETGETMVVLGQTGFATMQSISGRYPALFLVAIPASGALLTLRQLSNDLSMTLLFTLLLFSLGVWLLSNQVLLPLKRVTQAAARVNSQDLSQRVPVPRTRDELSHLAVTLNSMLGRLQESFETQRRFTADASHELRTPVTAISGHVSYLLRRTKPSPEQQDSLDVIKRESERMAKLVNDLLELARADAGFRVERAPMNLVEVLESSHMAIAPLAGSTEIEVSSALPLVEVSGDPERLKQVVLNLLANAINAGSRHVVLSLTSDKQQAQLEVLDDGPGIPSEAIPHLFERFYRVDTARSTRGNGSGLGLAIVKWIVQQHEGEVLVRSRVGEGTVFTILLPLLHPKAADSRALAPARAPGVLKET